MQRQHKTISWADHRLRNTKTNPLRFVLTFKMNIPRRLNTTTLWHIRLAGLSIIRLLKFVNTIKEAMLDPLKYRPGSLSIGLQPKNSGTIKWIEIQDCYLPIVRSTSHLHIKVSSQSMHNNSKIQYFVTHRIVSFDYATCFFCSNTLRCQFTMSTGKYIQ